MGAHVALDDLIDNASDTLEEAAIEHAPPRTQPEEMRQTGINLTGLPLAENFTATGGDLAQHQTGSADSMMQEGIGGTPTSGTIQSIEFTSITQTQTTTDALSVQQGIDEVDRDANPSYG